MKKLVLLILLTMLFIFPMQSQGDVVTFELDYEFSGAYEPEGESPWLKATIWDYDTDIVRIKMEDLNLTDGEFVKGWYFNLDLGPDDIVWVAFIEGVTGSASYGSFQADGDGIFDIEFAFPEGPPSARFGVGDYSIWQFSGLLGLTAQSFNIYSESGGGAGTYHTAAHVLGIGPEDQWSGWIGDTNGGGGQNGEIPEPISLILLGSGLAGVGLYRRFKKPRG